MQLLTVKQAAKNPAIPLNEYQLRKLIARGECPGFRSGNRFYVNVEQLLGRLDEISVPKSATEGGGGHGRYV